MNVRIRRGIRLVAALVVVVPSGSAVRPHAAVMPETLTITIKVNPSPAQSTEIRLSNSFPMEKDEAGDVFFSQAQFLSSDPRGRIYVTDIRTCQVFVFDPEGNFLRKIGRPGQGPGEFNKPARALMSRNLLAVLDGGNTRVQYFDEKGQFARSARLAKNYVDMAIALDGTIYGVTSRKQPGDMIDALSAAGERLFSFGRPPDSVAGGQGPSQSRLSMSPRDELFVAYWFAPIVQIYSPGGELRTVFEIQYKPMQDKLARNPAMKKAMPGGGRAVGESIIEAIYVTESSFLILHRGSQGRIDILESKKDGTFLRDYWTVQTPDYYPMGLVVRDAGGKKVFYLLQVFPENRVDVFYEQ